MRDPVGTISAVISLTRVNLYSGTWQYFELTLGG
jgi:hypothetical protein